MKKLFIIVLSLLIITGCSNTSEADNQQQEDNRTENILLATSTYQVFNSLDSKITELYLYETNLDKSENMVGEDGLKCNDYISLTYKGSIGSILTIEYVCEDGETGKYDSLSMNDTPINLLGKNQRVGGSIVEFVVPNGEGVYTVYNSTGGNITELYLYESSSNRGKNYASDGIVNGDKIELSYHAPLNTFLTLEYMTDTGETGIFKTLKIETVPIWIIAEDARTGATVVSFESPK